MLDFFHEFENRSVVIFVIHHRQLVKKNVVVKINKLLKIFIRFDSSFYV